MRISDWSSDVCSYDLKVPLAITAITSSELERSGIRDLQGVAATVPGLNLGEQLGVAKISLRGIGLESLQPGAEGSIAFHVDGVFISRSRSEEHTSELQSLMRISYAVFCLKKKKKQITKN